MSLLRALLTAGIICAASLFSIAQAEPIKDDVIVNSEEIKWGAGPAALPHGAESVVLYGDPAEEGLFAMRVKVPKGYRIPPHTHSKPEIVTVISGATRLGMGETADEKNTQSFKQGGFMAMPPGMAHFVYVEEDTVIQLNSVGPWEINYINPTDDPRRKTQ
jgi:quercetin dioxygenase-like cupin family protein